jgi:homocysteine S-methyltransferase
MTLAFQRIQDSTLRQTLTERGICLGAYANRLTPVASDWTMAESDGAQPMRDDLSPQVYHDKFVSRWIQDYNVQIVGGCCGITPDHIAYIRSKVKQDLAQV